MEKTKKIYIAGHNGLVGSHIVRALRERGFKKVLCRTREELDLTQQDRVREFFKQEKPHSVIVAAGRVGNLQENAAHMTEFLVENVLIATNVIQASADFGVQKLVYLGSNCAYPVNAEQPYNEKSLLTGSLEPTNEGYALAKLVGIKLCDFYRREHGKEFLSVIPASLYGPGDSFDLKKCHVIPAMIRKLHEAKVKQLPQVTLWGTGNPKREYLFIDDFVEGLLFLMDKYTGRETTNLGSGQEVSVLELAEIIKEVVEFPGALTFNPSYPDGAARKILDSQKVRALGWKPQTRLKEGLVKTYYWALKENILHGGTVQRPVGLL